ncbi:MAG: Gfo/Idh/MocA family protein [Cellulosilyticaceae bacterium]
MERVRVGIVGIGDISGIYLENITHLYQDTLEIVGICDLVREKAERASEKYGIETIYEDMHALFADERIEIVLNLTRPYEHFEVSKAALLAGKNVYSEKPLGATFEEGQALVALAAEKQLRMGGAPDTFLGAGIQTCRKLIEDGYIGTPVGASAFMVCRGHETWHPDPEFYYKHGGGPMMDMGPYYISALVTLLGGIKQVSGMAKISFPERKITSNPHAGEVIKVDVPTYVAGMMQFESGAVGTIFTTFDAYKAEMPCIEIYGSEGTLSVPDPNTFGGPIRIYRPSKGEFLEFPLVFDYPQNSRGLGLSDMAIAIRTGEQARASSNLTYHVLEVMTGFERSSEAGEHIAITSVFEKTPLMNI